MTAIPRPEYPRPSLVRNDNWLNLNGQWAFAFDFGNSGRDRKLWEAPDDPYTHEITVPFVPESKLSGIEYVDFIAACWYRRSFELPDNWNRQNGRILLHFGAVDYYSEIYVNHRKVGDHTGGYTPFVIDVTDAVNAGENMIAVFAEDPDMTAAVLEAMNSESYRSVIPAYYETALKVKYARDDETVQVLDILREGISMQFVDVYSTVFSGYSEIFRTTLAQNKETWASDVACIKEAALTKLADLIAYYEK